MSETKSKPAASQSGDTAMRDILVRLSAEIEHAVEQLVAIEIAVSVMSEHLCHLDSPVMQNIQQVDKVRQSLEALSGFTADIAEQVPRSLIVDCGEAANRIKLSDLARRLLAGASAANTGKPMDYGEVDLFV